MSKEEVSLEEKIKYISDNCNWYVINHTYQADGVVFSYPNDDITDESKAPELPPSYLSSDEWKNWDVVVTIKYKPKNYLDSGCDMYVCSSLDQAIDSVYEELLQP